MDLCISDIVHAIRDVYKISAVLGWSLAIVAYLFCGHFVGSGFNVRLRLNLHELARHNVIEHNGSLGHADVHPGDRYAPTTPDITLLSQTRDSKWPPSLPFPSKKPGFIMGTLRNILLCSKKREKAGQMDPLKKEDGHTTFPDLVWARYLRDREMAGQLDPIHRQLAVGEVALMASVLSKNTDDKLVDWHFPTDWLTIWLGEDRLPLDEGWEPPKSTVGLVRITQIANYVKTIVSQQHRKPDGI